MLLCLHEESAVAIAHGYAKVTGKAMAAAVHSNVGLMHATMAIFNAWCDRMPMLVLGATGPVDATKRRPWIDWIHTARDQGALVRGYTKWDDQPASPVAAREAMLRAGWIANTAPRGPIYVNLDAEMQEAQAGRAGAADRRRSATCRRSRARRRPEAVEASRRAAAQRQASGDPGRPRLARSRRLERARRARRAPRRARHHRSEGRRLLPDRSSAACRRARHASRRRRKRPTRIRAADVILSLDWVDLAGTFKASAATSRAKVVQVSLDHHLHNGWSMDYQGLPPVDVLIACRSGCRGAGFARGARAERSAARSPPAPPEFPKLSRRQAHRRSSGRRAAPRGRRPARPRSPICRCPGTAPAGRSAIRSTISAPTAAAASAAAPAFRSAPRSR